MSAESVDASRRFSLVVGGPFHAVLRRLGWVGDDQLPLTRAALIMALAAWLPPALLVTAQSLLDESYSGWAYFSDATVVARYLIAIFAMIATERHADRRIVLLIEQFRDARIVADGYEAEFREAFARADRQSSSTVAEATIAAIALAWAAVAVRITIATVDSAWEGHLAGEQVALSWGGTFSSLVSTPLFIFLALRGCWRSVVWTVLLLRLSRLPLALMPLHPDRCAGLGFLSIYPSIFTGFVFAVSCSATSTILRELEAVDMSADHVRWMVGGWIALILTVFVGPLSVFVPVLQRAREQALLEYGRLVHQHHIGFRQKWLASGRSGVDLMGSSDVASLSDLNQSLAPVHEMRIFPIDRFALFQLLAATCIPLSAVVLKQVPLAELLRRVGLGFL